ncbi:unnamed protein product, partial [Iphiclides podalirius]
MAVNRSCVFIFSVVYCLALAHILDVSDAYSQRECGISLRRHTRQPRERSAGQLRIIRGRESKRGAWPWQVSLQLLHPNYGLIGHWCGGVLIHPLWLLTTAHCIHNELFNLPVAALWTAVLGEWDRAEQKGSYVPIEKVILHHRFHNYQHDIALMKMTRAADVSAGSRIRTICLPSYESPLANYEPEKGTSFYVRPNSEIARKKSAKRPKPNPDTTSKYLEKLNNLTKSTFPSYSNKKHKNLRYNIRVSEDSSGYSEKRTDDDLRADDEKNRDVVYDRITLDSVVRLIKTKNGPDNDEARGEERSDGAGEDKGEGQSESREERKLMFGEEIEPYVEENGLETRDECYATGWGRQQTNGSLTDVLLEAEVPLLPLAACRERYALPLPLGAGHLCAGSTDGSTGACVGDSGGPLQCRSGGSGGAGGRVGGRWELRGLTSFGSGCARRGVPDVYTNVAHYTAWIYAHIYAG